MYLDREYRGKFHISLSRNCKSLATLAEIFHVETICILRDEGVKSFTCIPGPGHDMLALTYNVDARHTIYMWLEAQFDPFYSADIDL